MEKLTKVVYQPNFANVVELDSGLMPISQLACGDVVFNKQGEQIQVKTLHKAVSPVLKLMQSDGTSFYVAGDFILKNRNHSYSRLNATNDLVLQTTSKRSKYYSNKCNPIQFGCDISGLCNPWLLGVFLGDGIVLKDGRNGKFKPGLSLASGTDEIPNRISELLGGYWKLQKAYTYDFYLPEEQQKGRNKKHSRYVVFNGVEGVNAYCGEKFIDSKFLYSSVENRVELLKGLMDTDGTVNTNGYLFFSTTSEQLAKDFQILCWSLGFRCTQQNLPNRNELRFHISGTNEQKAQIVSESSRVGKLSDRPSACFSNSIVGVEKIGMVECIGVETESLVVDSFNVVEMVV